MRMKNTKCRVEGGHARGPEMFRISILCVMLYFFKKKREIRRKQQNVVLLKLNCEYTACKLSVCLTVFIVCELEGERGKEGATERGS